MPHVPSVNQAIGDVAALAAGLDDAIVAHIVDGTRLPTLASLESRARPIVRAAVVDAFDDIDPDWTDAEVRAETDRIIGLLLIGWRRSLNDARRNRERTERVKAAPTDDDDEADSVAGLVRVATSAGLGVAVALAKRKARSRTVLAQLAAASGAPLRPASSGLSAQTVRTEIAEGRNRYAAAVAERKGMVIRVEDARKGPTDKPCEDVNGKYATAAWLRRHPTEHPSCTRRGRPVRLPAGATVTLLE